MFLPRCSLAEHSVHVVNTIVHATIPNRHSQVISSSQNGRWLVARVSRNRNGSSQCCGGETMCVDNVVQGQAAEFVKYYPGVLGIPP